MPSKPALAPHQGRALAANEVIANPDGVVRLLGVQCNDCGMKVFPVTDVCPDCLSSSLRTMTLGGNGKLYSYTTVHVAPPGWETPYVVGYVDMPEGVRLFGKVKAGGPDALRVDMPIGVRVVADGDRYRYYFEPGLQ
ncbi:MAG: OB-fold domain-containing protein [Pseudomonadota bacterium]